MKILFITRKFPPSIGGMELFAAELSAALAAKSEIKLVKWGGHGRIKAVLIALPYLFIRSFFSLSRGNIDVIHAQDGVLAPIAFLLAKIWRKPFVVVIHGLDATYNNPLFRAVVPAAVRRANRVFCISQAAADEVVKLGVTKDRVRIITLGIQDKYDPSLTQSQARERLGLAKDARVLITVGRLVKRKGVARFINSVLPNLVQQYPDLLYLVVGEGEERPAIEAAITKHKLQKQVLLLGRISDEQRAVAYTAADLFMMPNINVPNDVEGFGLVLIEASTYKLPVVAANTEGIADAVNDGKNGVLVPVGDVAAYTTETSHFLDDLMAAKKFGVASRNFTLANYQWDKIADQYIAEYQRLLD